MLKTIKENKMLAALLAIGLVCALILCGVRVGMERGNNEFCVIMSTDDAALLKGELAGVRLFDGEHILDDTLLLVEDENQYSYRPLPTSIYENWDSRQVRCFKADGKFAERYATLGYEGAEEIENMLYRAVTDRNIRVVWLTPFVNSETGKVITDAAIYSEVVENLAARTERHGLTMGESFSVFDPHYEPSSLLLIGAMLGVFCAGVALLHSLCKLPKWFAMLGLIACPSMTFVLPGLAAPIFAFAASVIFPSLSLWYMAVRLGESEASPLPRALGTYLGILAVSLLISLAGGLFVGALQSSTDYLLAVDNFRGVKLSQVLPILFGLIYALRYISLPHDILNAKKYILILAVVLLGAAVAYYLLRTGNFSVSILEQRFRNWLELALIVRPRTKEFLAAWPSLAICVALCAGGKRVYTWPFAILSSVGFASVVNTFCHSRAPLWLSTYRSLTGAAIGAFIGCIAIATLTPLLRRKPAT